MANTTKQSSKSTFELLCGDLRTCWREQPDKGFFAALLLPWVALFYFLGNSTFGYVDTPSLFGWMHYVFTTSPYDSYCLYIPFVVAALLIWKREQLRAVHKSVWLPAFGIVVVAVVLHVLGYMVQQTRLSIIGFFLGVYGLTGLVWGRQWLRASFFPMFLLVFCVPIGTMAEAITLPLRLLVTKISVGIGHDVLAIDVFRNGSRIFDGRGTPLYDVAPACSGINSLISLLALTTIHGFVTFKTGWKRVLVAATAVPLAVAGNVIRITTVIIIGEAFGHQAGKAVEQKLGFVTFAVAIVAVMALGHWLRDREPPDYSGMEVEPA